MPEASKDKVLVCLKELCRLFLPGFEPGTFRVLGERDDRYTTETDEDGIRGMQHLV